MRFKTHVSKNKTLFLAGRTDENNEELISQVKSDEFVFHTKNPGSPFVNIKGNSKEGDFREAAIFCARYSRDWKKNKSDVLIHKFLGKSIYKEKSMKVGTFGVKKLEELKIKKEEILSFKLNPVKKGLLIELEKQGIINTQEL